MKKIFYVVFLSSALLMAVLSAPLYSMDLGLFCNFSGGSGSAEDYDSGESEDQSSSGYGFGLIATGHFANNSIINRFMFTYDYREVEIDAWGSYQEFYIDSNSVYDTIGFVVHSTKTSEIWMGPRLGLSGSEATDYYDYEYEDGGGLSLGIVSGVDVLLNENVVLGAEAGLIYGVIFFEDEVGSGADIYTLEGYLGLSLMLRI